MNRTTRWIACILATAGLLAGCGKKDKDKAATAAPRPSPTPASLDSNLVPPDRSANARDDLGFTPLHEAAARRKGITEAIRKGADVNAKDSQIGWTALHWAASDGDVDLIRQLLAARADVHAADRNGKTPLQVACASGHLEAVRTLLGARANPNAVDANGLTALHHAVQGGNKEVVSLLLAKRVNANAATKAGLTPLQMAIFGGQTEIADALRSHGAAPAALPDRLAPLPQPDRPSRPS